MASFSLGCDPELFVKSAVGHKAICGLIGGTKEEPIPFDKLGYGYFLQEDNVALEFNIPPATSKKDFSTSLKYMIREIEVKLKNKHGLSISPECAVFFDEKELLHPNALVFGCEPDYDAWKKVENKKPTCPYPNLRTAGGHIHVGTNVVDMVQGVQNMDLYLGVPSIVLDNSPNSILRRELYGKAGSMRPTPWGWEYRVLSNFWIFDSALTDWVWDATRQACMSKHKFTKKEAETIQNCINSGDKSLALELIDHYHLKMPIFKEDQGELNVAP